MIAERMRSLLAGSMLASIALVLAACGHVDVDATFYSGERWETVAELGFPIQALTFYGGSPDEIDGQLDEMVAHTRLEGVRASWSRVDTEDEIVYTIAMKGRGLDKLSSAAFEQEADIYVERQGGRRVIRFRYYVDPSLAIQPHTITLRGGEIIDGNGRLLDKSTMTWRNASGYLEATLTERSRVSVLGLLGILAVVAVLTILVAGGIYLRRRSRSAPPAPCPQCGFWVPEGARFCPGCGRPRD